MNEVLRHKAQSEVGVTLSEHAVQHFLAYLKKQTTHQGIRFSVKKTGCSGLSYVVDYVEVAHDDDIVQSWVDGYSIYIDRKSYPYLKGMTVDYVKQGLNQKLTFNNPNQTGQCGCGESFTVEESE